MSLGLSLTSIRRGGSSGALTFPTTPILDAFNRANEVPLSVAGNWDASPWAGAAFDLTSNQIQLNAAGVTAQQGGQVWGVSLSGGVEIYLTVVTLPTLIHTTRQFVDLGIIVVGSESLVNGYLFRADDVFGGHLWQIREYDDGATNVLLRSVTGPTLSAGDKIGYQRTATGIMTMWHCPVSTGIWVQVGTSVQNATYTGPWKLQVVLYDATVRVDDFGGGAF